MKKIILTVLAIAFSVTIASASSTQEVLTLFNKYVNDANTYKPTIITMYSPNAKIIRQVVKPDGSTANATTNMSVYAKQMRISQTFAKMNNYKNTYTNVTAKILPNGDIKVSALRQPMKDNDRLKTYQIWHKQANGSWIIVEEMMQTKQQIFLRYADKK